jgi:hypothetical protein
MEEKESRMVLAEALYDLDRMNIKLAASQSHRAYLAADTAAARAQLIVDKIAHKIVTTKAFKPKCLASTALSGVKTSPVLSPSIAGEEIPKIFLGADEDDYEVEEEVVAVEFEGSRRKVESHGIGKIAKNKAATEESMSIPSIDGSSFSMQFEDEFDTSSADDNFDRVSSIEDLENLGDSHSR